MSITVNTNMSSIIAQRSLYKATNKMNTALERLSTGLRINSSKDDAAGSAISTKLEYKMSSYDVAKDNAQMGQSMLDTANGTLSNINSMLQRMRDLSEQASNGTYGEDERKAMQAEIDGLTEEIYRIKNTTEFNGKKILGEQEYSDYSNPDISMSIIDVENMTQSIWNSKYQGKIIGINSAQEFKNIAVLNNDKGIDLSNTTFALTSDINLDDLGLDANGSNWTSIGIKQDDEENKTFKGNFNGNGYTISNLKINTTKTDILDDGTDSNLGLFGYVDNAEIKNMLLDNAQVKGYKYIGALVGSSSNSTISNCHIKNANVNGTSSNTGGCVGYNLNGSYIKDSSFEGNVKGGTTTGGFVGWNKDSNIDNCYANANVIGSGSQAGCFAGSTNHGIISNCQATGTVSGLATKPNWIGGFAGAITNFGEYINCKSTAEILGDQSTFREVGSFLGRQVGDNYTIKGCEYDTDKSSLKPAGNFDAIDNEIKGVSGLTITQTEPIEIKKQSQIINNVNLQVGINSDLSSVISIDTAFTLEKIDVDLSTDSSARNSLLRIDRIMSAITDKMTEIGATQNRLESTIEFQEVQRNALTSANSLIKDADIAKESANYVKNQILQNVTSTLLSTANQNPSIALQLI